MVAPVPVVGNFDTQSSSSGTSVTTTAITTRPGSGLYLSVLTDTGVTITNVSDSFGNDYRPYFLDTTRDTDTAGRLYRYFLPHNVGARGASHTVTLTTNATSFKTVFFVEVLNRPKWVQGSSIVDSGTPFTSPSETSRYPDELFLVTCMSNGTETNMTPGGSFTEIVENNDASQWHGHVCQRTLTAIGSAQSSTTMDSSLACVCIDGFIYDNPAGVTTPYNWYDEDGGNDGFVLPTLMDSDGWF